MSVQTKSVVGLDICNYLDAIANLRIRIFREFPYLYDGDLEYEQRYLATYSQSENALAIIAFNDEQVVGVSTGVPMSEETPAFKQPFIDAGKDPAKIFYCGESILLPEFRGGGVYRRFFEGRESYARGLPGIEEICFCAVFRPEDHPLRPALYQPLDAIWRHFGYRLADNLIAHYEWKDIDQPEQTKHAMQFWIKSLALHI